MMTVKKTRKSTLHEKCRTQRLKVMIQTKVKICQIFLPERELLCPYRLFCQIRDEKRTILIHFQHEEIIREIWRHIAGEGGNPPAASMVSIASR